MPSIKHGAKIKYSIRNTLVNHDILLFAKDSWVVDFLTIAPPKWKAKYLWNSVISLLNMKWNIFFDRSKRRIRFNLRSKVSLCYYLYGFLGTMNNLFQQPFLSRITVYTDQSPTYHDDVIKWNHFRRCWPFYEGNPPVPIASPHKCQWRGAFVFFDLRLNKRLSKQSRRQWFETTSRTLWRHCNGIALPSNVVYLQNLANRSVHSFGIDLITIRPCHRCIGIFQAWYKYLLHKWALTHRGWVTNTRVRILRLYCFR